MHTSYFKDDVNLTSVAILPTNFNEWVLTRYYGAPLYRICYKSDRAYIKPQYHFIILFIYRWNTKGFVLYLSTAIVLSQIQNIIFLAYYKNMGFMRKFVISNHDILSDNDYRYSKNRLCIWLQNFKQNYMIHFVFNWIINFYWNLGPCIISHF